MPLPRILLALMLCALGIAAIRAADEAPPNTGMADPAALVSAFDRFAAGGADPNVVVLPLSNLRGVSSEARNAGGSVRIDLVPGRITWTLRLMPPGETFDLWLVDNLPGSGRTTLAESGDDLRNLATFDSASGGGVVTRDLGPDFFTDFFPDRAFVVRSGLSPLEGFVLTGSSPLFTRLQHRQVGVVNEGTLARGFDPAAEDTREADFARLVQQGRRLFLNETFDGNGRTCGTCHVETNNFTIDPQLMATLPGTDPLFVAETNPALSTLERPDLLRRFGLVLVNADGFDPSGVGPEFVLRATQNVQAIANSSMTPDATIDFTVNARTPNPPERLGWGNDGAPLRDFALVAIVQHAPRTLARVRNVDFRVPTDGELDALAAYQLALGRQEDFELPTLVLKSTLATTGKTLYLDTGNIGETGHKNCNACHFNAGGTAAMAFSPLIRGFPDMDGSPRGFNMTAETNANEIPLALSLGLPRDGGFGLAPTIFGSFGNVLDNPILGHLELEGFNSPPVVESADTGPFFHNHSVTDLESAVAFYGTPAFQTSIFGSPPVISVTISADPNDHEVQAIAAFLRVLNALENIRSSINVAERGCRMVAADDKRDLARLALAEAIDAMQVLSEGALARPIEPGILAARVRLLGARGALEAADHLRRPDAIDSLLTVAVLNLRAARAELADPATLPVSFRN